VEKRIVDESLIEEKTIPPEEADENRTKVAEGAVQSWVLVVDVTVVVVVDTYGTIQLSDCDVDGMEPPVEFRPLQIHRVLVV